MFMLYRREDRATLRSDPSALLGLQGGGTEGYRLFYCLPETNALNLVVWDSAPRWSKSFRKRDIKRIVSGSNIVIIFVW